MTSQPTPPKPSLQRHRPTAGLLGSMRHVPRPEQPKGQPVGRAIDSQPGPPHEYCSCERQRQ